MYVCHLNINFFSFLSFTLALLSFYTTYYLSKNHDIFFCLSIKNLTVCKKLRQCKSSQKNTRLTKTTVGCIEKKTWRRKNLFVFIESLFSPFAVPFSQIDGSTISCIVHYLPNCIFIHQNIQSLININCWKRKKNI